MTKTVDPDRLQALFGTLHRRYGSQRAVASSLGVPQSSLNEALKGKSGTDYTASLLTRMELQVAKLGSQEANAPPDAVPPPPPTSTVLDHLGGITTDDDVPYVLTAESFREIECRDVLALRDSLITSIRLTRGQLNLASQLKSKDARELLQDEVGKELQELELSMRTFTHSFPNQLLPLYDGQREVWKQSQPSNRRTRKGST